MSDRDKAEDLLKQYNIKHYYNLVNGESVPVSMHDGLILQCAKTDLINRINFLIKIIDKLAKKQMRVFYLNDELQSLENQLTHLNNL